MLFSLDGLTKDILKILDLTPGVHDILADEKDETAQGVEAIILQAIPTAVREVEMIAPSKMLESLSSLDECDFFRDNKGIIQIVLPPNFLRLINFKMSDWDMAVYSLIEPHSPQYLMQFSPHKGIRANHQRPMVAITDYGNGKMLEVFGSEDEKAVVVQSFYLPIRRVQHNYIEISRQCLSAVLYMAASMAAQSLGDGNAAAALSQKTKELLTI